MIRASAFKAKLPDAVDALIVASADVYSFSMLTADAGILAWKGKVKWIDACN